MTININTRYLLIFISVIKLAMKNGNWLTVKNFIKMKDPIISISIIAVVVPASIIEFNKLFKLSFLVASVIIIAPNAPIAPASVGVKIPM